jgi:hypothetical protein
MRRFVGRRRRRRRSSGSSAAKIAVVVILLGAAVFGLINVEDLQQLLPGPGGGQTVQGPGGSEDPADARQALQKLEVKPSGSMAGYSREKFPHWSDAQEFGWKVSDSSCDARDAALIRDGTDVKVGKGCDVTSGKWLDPYTGNTYTDLM